jgi:hypothetical protein
MTNKCYLNKLAALASKWMQENRFSTDLTGEQTSDIRAPQAVRDPGWWISPVHIGLGTQFGVGWGEPSHQ